MRREIGEAHRARVTVCWDEDSRWIELRRLPSGKSWQMAPIRARQLALLLMDAADASDHVGKTEPISRELAIVKAAMKWASLADEYGAGPLGPGLALRNAVIDAAL